MWLLDVIKPNISLIVQNFGYKNCLYLVLIKLKLGLMNQNLAIWFNLNEAKVSKMFRKWIKPLSVLLKNLTVWLDGAVWKNLPSSFSSFKNCVCIIDGTEIFIERPQNQLVQSQVYSNYKFQILQERFKYLIGITPASVVSFLSYGWGGHASDKMATLNSGFLEMVSHEDYILPDHGFLTEEELTACGAVLRIPAFIWGKNNWQLKALIYLNKMLTFG